MDDNVIKQLINQKQIYETPDGEKFDTELAAIMYIKAKLQTQETFTHPFHHTIVIDRKFDLNELPRTPDYDLWNIPPVTSNHGQVSAPQHKVKWF